MDDVAAVAAPVARDDPDQRRRHRAALSERRAEAPRQNSCARPTKAKVAKTKRARAQGRCAASVSSARTTPAPAATAAGTRKTRLAVLQLTRRQASSGPIPVKRTS